jgi:hypothetical protein
VDFAADTAAGTGIYAISRNSPAQSAAGQKKFAREK